MRKILSFLTLAALLFACGDAGVGFNISKNIPVEIPVFFDATTLQDAADLVGGFDPPASPPISDTYDLSDIGEDVNDIPEVVVNQLAFEITDIEAAEEIDVDNITIDLILADNSRINLAANLTRLENSSDIVVIPATASQLESLASTLIDAKRIGFEVIFDFAEVPTQNLDFNYNLYFDVTAKLRVD